MYKYNLSFFFILGFLYLNQITCKINSKKDVANVYSKHIIHIVPLAINSDTVSLSVLKITGLNQSKILNETDDVIKYEYEEGEKLHLTCTYTKDSKTIVPYTVSWKFETNNSYNNGTVGDDMKLLDPEDITKRASYEKMISYLILNSIHVYDSLFLYSMESSNIESIRRKDNEVFTLIFKTIVSATTRLQYKNTVIIDVTLNKQKRIKAIVCHVEEITRQMRKVDPIEKRIVLIVKDKIIEINNSGNHETNNMNSLEPTKNNETGKPDDLKNPSKTPDLMKIVYSVCAILAAMILIAFIVLMNRACSHNKIINQQQDTIVHCNTATENCHSLTSDEAYSNPTDVYKDVTDPVNSDYSDPYAALYTNPIPKPIRRNLKKNEYSNTVKKNHYENLKDRKRVNRNETIPYANLNKEYVSKYVNLSGIKNEMHGNLNETESDLYYSVVEK